MVRTGLGYLAAADAARLGTAAQAECLRELERAEAVLTAARAFVLAGFTAGQGYSGDADYSPRAWLIHKTRVSKGAAVAHTAWARHSTGLGCHRPAQSPLITSWSAQITHPRERRWLVQSDETATGAVVTCSLVVARREVWSAPIYAAGQQLLGWALGLLSIIYHALVYAQGGRLLKRP